MGKRDGFMLDVRTFISCNVLRGSIFAAAALGMGSCLTSCFTSSVYKFQSQPPEASVYHVNGSEKNLLGQTPIDFTKTNLPSDAPFTVLFEKPGYVAKEISVTPTDNSQTIVSATLKPSDDAFTDASTKKSRDLLKKIFEIQEMTARQKYVDALAALKRLEDQEPSIAEIFAMKGSIYVLLNDPDAARGQWEKALKIDPGMEDLRVRLKALPGAKKGVAP
jgi:hypothetical protein